MRKQEWIDLLKELLGVIEKCQCYHARDNQIGFNVKVYSYPRENEVLDPLREKYSENQEILDAIDRFEESIYKPYGIFDSYKQRDWDYAEEYFVDMCAIDSKGYILKNYKRYPLIKTKKMALKVEKQNDKLRRAFSKLNTLYQAGRMGGYIIFDYDFYMTKSDVENAIYDLENDATLTEIKEYYDLSVRGIKEEMEDLLLIKEEVEKFVEGHRVGWKEELTERIKDELIEHLPSGRKTLSNMLSCFKYLVSESNNIGEEAWKEIISKENTDIPSNIQESVRIIEDLLKDEYSNDHIEV